MAKGMERRRKKRCYQGRLYLNDDRLALRNTKSIGRRGATMESPLEGIPFEKVCVGDKAGRK